MNNQIKLFSKRWEKLTCMLLVCFFTSFSYANKVDDFKNKKTNQVKQKTITGTIKDINGMPLLGASVVEKGTTNGVQTDFDGKYSIKVANNATLVFSYLGFVNKEVNVSSKNVVNVVLEEDISSLDEIVIVGYGTQKKINVTGAVSSIKANDVVSTPAPNARSLLIGQVPGLITNQNPGLPGQDGVGLSIRGFGNPLVIVDGVESSFDRLDSNDIEDISILKDAAAAIYGVRGGDGVILVTTKRGKTGAAKLSYHGYTGFQNPIKFLQPSSAAAYVQAKRNGIFNTQYNPDFPDAPIDYGPEWSEERLAQYQSGELPSYDWVDALLKSSGSQLSAHNFSVSGGSEKVRYFTSLGFLNQNAIFKGDYSYNKFNITNNLDVDLTDDLSLSLNSSYIDETTDYPAAGIGELWNDLRTAQPFYNPELPDPDRAPYSGFSQRSPVARIYQRFGGYNLNETKTLAAALELKYKLPFIKGLTAGARANVRQRDRKSFRLTKTYGIYEYFPETDTYRLEQTVNPEPLFSRGFLAGDGDPTMRFLSRFYLNFDNTFGKHKVSGLVFVENEYNEVDNINILRRDLLSDEVEQIGTSLNETTEINGRGIPGEYARLSYAGRFNYSFDNKYLFEATIRADASSIVAPEARWGYFPSVSIGWNLAEESFLKDSMVDLLKLRLSYSETGRDTGIGYTTFDYLTGFTENGGIYYLDGEAVPTIRTEGLVNRNLSWINIINYNAGLDFRLLKGKFYGGVDAFYRIREGLFGAAIEEVPSIFGANLPQVNINSRNDRGVEFNLGYKGRIGDLKINLDGNFTYARERFQNIQQDIDFDDPNQVRIDFLNGRHVNRTFGYVSDGLINTQDELDAYINATTFETLDGGLPQLGDIKYVDVSGPDGVPDGVINRFDVQEIGYGSSPDINFGFNAKLTYKNVSLTALFQGASMFDVRAQGGVFRNPFDNEMSLLTLHEEYSWTQDPNNPGVGNNPNAALPGYTDNGGRDWNNNFSDFWLRDGTYLRLKTVTLNYAVDKDILDKIGFKNLSFYVTGDNLFTWTRLGIYDDVIDPEQSYNNSGYSIPLLRTFTFGLKMGL